MSDTQLIYLASPYNHEDASVREARFRAVRAETAKMLLEGYAVYSPILHNHPLAVHENLPGTWGFWGSLDLAILDRCDQLSVLKLPGWETSQGINAEITFAKTHGVPIDFLDPTVPIEAVPAPSLRSDWLARADEIINGPRQSEYGGPEASFARIASLWTAYLSIIDYDAPSGDELAPYEVAIMMNLMKIARLVQTNGRHTDSWLDMIGYAATGAEAANISAAGKAPLPVQSPLPLRQRDEPIAAEPTPPEFGGKCTACGNFGSAILADGRCDVCHRNEIYPR